MNFGERFFNKVKDEYYDYYKAWNVSNEKELFSSAIIASRKSFSQSELIAAKQGFTEAIMRVSSDRIKEIMENDVQKLIFDEMGRFTELISEKISPF